MESERKRERGTEREKHDWSAGREVLLKVYRIDGGKATGLITGEQRR